MKNVELTLTGRWFATAVITGAVLLLGSCTVNVNDKKDGNKKVEIETPFASVKVNEGSADVRDTGLPLYPGAQQKTKNGSDSSNANVNLSAGKAGLRVVAITFQSDDGPDKVLGFYRDKMGKYGKVLECKGGTLGTVHTKDQGDQLSCDSKGDSDTVELKVGTEHRQRVVAVKPNGKGSEFSLVYVRTHGEADDTI